MTNSIIRAADVLSSFGINTHIPYTDGGYDNLTNVDADLRYLGITQVRDSISNGAGGSAPLSSFVQLAQEGVRFTFSVGGGTTSSLQATLNLVKQLNTIMPGSVTAVEGANEINNWPVTFNGVTGLQGAIDLQRAIYSSVHSDPGLAGVAVDYFTGYAAGNVAAGPDPSTVSGLADYDTQHPYPNHGEAPQYWVDPSFALGNEGSSKGPFVYTETGYSTYGNGDGVVSEDVQAKYTLDLLLDTLKDGASHTFLYQLMDAYAPGSPQGDDGFGLFDPSNAPKPSATAIHNLTSILADTGSTAATFTPAAIGYTISGLPAGGNSLQIGNSAGFVDIAVWAEPQIWNSTTHAEISAPTITATVDLGATYAHVAVFDPLAGSTPLRSLSNVSSVQIGLTDHPLIIEVGSALTPKSAPLQVTESADVAAATPAPAPVYATQSAATAMASPALAVFPQGLTTAATALAPVDQPAVTPPPPQEGLDTQALTTISTPAVINSDPTATAAKPSIPDQVAGPVSSSPPLDGVAVVDLGGTLFIGTQNAAGIGPVLVDLPHGTVSRGGDLNAYISSIQGVTLGGDPSVVLGLTFGTDLIYGGSGDDQFYNEGATDYIQGGSSSNEIIGGIGTTIFYGNGGSDVMLGGSGQNFMQAGPTATSTDVFYGNGGTDFVYGGPGATDLIGGSGTEDLTGGSGYNQLVGSNQSASALNILNGGTGTDVFYAGIGTNLLYEGTGTDVLAGNAGTDYVYGGVGRSFIYGGSGTDVITTGAGNQYVQAGTGQTFFNDTAANLTAGRFDQIDNFTGGQGTNLYLPTTDKDATSFISQNGGTAVLTSVVGGGTAEIFASGTDASTVQSHTHFTL